MPAWERATAGSSRKALSDSYASSHRIMAAPEPLQGYVASLYDEIRTIWLGDAEQSRPVITLQLSHILMPVLPTVAIDYAVGAVCGRCYDLFEALKRCESPGRSDFNKVALARVAALHAVDYLQHALQSATPSAQAIALGLVGPLPAASSVPLTGARDGAALVQAGHSSARNGDRVATLFAPAALLHRQDNPWGRGGNSRYA